MRQSVSKKAETSVFKVQLSDRQEERGAVPAKEELTVEHTKDGYCRKPTGKSGKRESKLYVD